jgi:hypothetical protein
MADPTPPNAESVKKACELRQKHTKEARSCKQAHVHTCKHVHILCVRTGDGPGEELRVKGGVLPGAEGVADGRVRAQLDARVAELAPVREEQALPKGGDALGPEDSVHGGGDAQTRHLHPRLHQFLCVCARVFCFFTPI